MTEAEWNNCTDPAKMLEFVRGKASDRKLRLFAVACCRKIWSLLIDERSRNAVEVAEKFADGLASFENLVLAHENATEAAQIAHDATVLPNDDTNEYPSSAAKYASDDLRFWDMRHAAGVCAADPEWAISNAVCVEGYRGPNPRIASRESQVALLRCIFGNPFRSVALDPRLLSPTVRNLAKFIYTDRAFDRLPILADALEDAGCTDDDILNHCRQPGKHCRGCWVVDLVLEKK